MATYVLFSTLAVMLILPDAESSTPLDACLYKSPTLKHMPELDKNHPLPAWWMCRNVSCISEIYRANGNEDFIPKNGESSEAETGDLTSLGLKEIEIEEMKCKDGKMPVQLFTGNKDTWGQAKQVWSLSSLSYFSDPSAPRSDAPLSSSEVAPNSSPHTGNGPTSI